MNREMNDWKLTAYALGELDAAEQADIEAKVRGSADLQREVEQIRATAGLLTRELQAALPVAKNIGPELTDAQRQTINKAVASSAWHNNGIGSAAHARPVLRRLRVPLAVAASIALCGIALYNFIPDLSAARGPAKRLANAQNIKGLGTSAKSYESKDPSGWPVPVHPQQFAKSETHIDGVGRPAVGIPPGVTYGDPRNAGQVGEAYERRQYGFNPTADASVRSSSGSYRVRRTIGDDYELLASADSTRWEVVEVYPTKFRDAKELAARVRQLEGAANNPTAFRDGADVELYALGLVEDESGNRRDPSSSERYSPIVENPFTLVEAEPLSTFSIDVDTAAYANIRRFLNSGRLPPADAVRIEEMVNYFDYDYPQPADEHPFSVNLEISECPWGPQHRLARIGIKGYELDPRERPAANLVFLIDVSGSMNTYDKLPLVQEALSLLIDQLDRRDSIGIVVYAGNSGVVLPPTNGQSKDVIREAVDRLSAGGSTNGAAGIEAAYQLASESFIEGGINRVILATDGDFNVGVTHQGELQRLIEEKKKSGVFLSVLGFGMGNLQDGTLETLADKGNGNYAYIDTLREAQKVLVDQMGGTLFTIAKDVKIQVEFNPLEVAAYRLVGYENRMLAAQDFNDDTKDAGEIGAGHTVTALYEIIPAGQAVETPPVDALKYQNVTDVTEAAESGEMMTVKLRYKEPDGETSKLIEVPVSDAGTGFAESSDDFAFAAAVASFGMLLRGSPHAASLDHAAVIEMAQSALGNDPTGYRAEFIELVQKAMQLHAAATNPAPSP